MPPFPFSDPLLRPEYPSFLSDDAISFLRLLLTKDPLQRPPLSALKRHPWLAADLPDVDAWARRTDPAALAAISVTSEEVKNAVTFMEKIRVQMRRLSTSMTNLMQRSRSTSTSTQGESAPESPRVAPLQGKMSA